MCKVITEHFGKADTIIEVVQLSKGNITVIHKDGEAVIFPSIYEAFRYESTGDSSIDRFYCLEEQLEFVYNNFNSYQDIKDNFNVGSTKRK